MMTTTSQNERSKNVDYYKNLLITESKYLRLPDPSDLDFVPKDHLNEIVDNCFLGDADAAMSKPTLRELGITHVLNAAKGEKFSQINTSQAYYDDCGVKFYGINLMDTESCKIEKHFDQAVDFINEALKNGGKILIHCFMGISRSATLLIAYLIRYRQIKLEEALRLVIRKRLIWPNDGFLKKLIDYEANILADKN